MHNLIVVFAVAILMVTLGGLFYVYQFTPPSPPPVVASPVPQATPNVKKIKDEIREEMRKELEAQKPQPVSQPVQPVERVYQPEPRPTPVVIEVRHEYVPANQPAQPVYQESQGYVPPHSIIRPGDGDVILTSGTTPTTKGKPYNPFRSSSNFQQEDELKPKSSKWKKVAVIAASAAAGAGITYAATRR